MATETGHNLSLLAEAISTSDRHNVNTKKRKGERAMHPRNKYTENPPDFTFLASKYPSFREYITYTTNGKSRIDWTDFNATRELTRVLLKHDFDIEWWIPDGQLCPTVPNRANYIHWIEDLLNSCPPPWHKSEDIKTWGLDIGTGANCIYPLLGAAIHGWHFVGTDITDIAIMWARRNAQENPRLTELIEIRRVKDCKWSANEKSFIEATSIDCSQSCESACCSLQFKVGSTAMVHTDGTGHKMTPIAEGCIPEDVQNKVALVPPPDTKAEDVEWLNMAEGSVDGALQPQMKNSAKVFHSSWFTTMVGRKVNLKVLIPKLRSKRVSMLRTTEFAQGRTSRWGLAWSFSPSQHDMPSPRIIADSASMSFMLQGLPRNFRAYDILQALVRHMQEFGAACRVDTTTFSFKGTLPPHLVERCGPIGSSQKRPREVLDVCERLLPSANDLQFHVSVFEHAPGALLIKGSLLDRKISLAGTFSAMLSSAEQSLKKQFLMEVPQR